MKLVYVGPNPAQVGIVPCPEGWPAANHEEPDSALAAEKVASGLYQEDKPQKPASSKSGEEE